MSTHHTINILSEGPGETAALGRRIGRSLGTGIVIALAGDLGSGKTVFVQGLAQGLGVPDSYYVTSPTYTLINEYPGSLTLFHIDLYRLESLDDIEALGVFDLFDTLNVVAIEWAERLQDEMPAEYLSVRFETLDERQRKICLTAYGLQPLNVVKGLQNQTVMDFNT